MSMGKPSRLEELLEREVKEGKKKSPLDELLEEEELELVREAKKARIEEILLDRELKKLEKEKRLRELKKELGIKDSNPIESLNLAPNEVGDILKFLLTLPENKRSDAIKLIAMIKAADKSSGLALLPLLVGTTQQPSMNITDIVKSVVDLLKSGMSYDQIKSLIDLAVETKTKDIAKAVEEIKKQVSFDPVSYFTEVLDRMQKLGLVRIPSTDQQLTQSNPALQLKLKELDLKMQALLKKLETEYMEKMFNMERQMAEFLHQLRKEEEREKRESEIQAKQIEAFKDTLGKAIDHIGGPIGTALGEIISKYLSELGKAPSTSGSAKQ